MFHVNINTRQVLRKYESIRMNEFEMKEWRKKQTKHIGAGKPFILSCLFFVFVSNADVWILIRTVYWKLTLYTPKHLSLVIAMKRRTKKKTQNIIVTVSREHFIGIKMFVFSLFLRAMMVHPQSLRLSYSIQMVWLSLAPKFCLIDFNLVVDVNEW